VVERQAGRQRLTQRERHTENKQREWGSDVHDEIQRNCIEILYLPKIHLPEV